MSLFKTNTTKDYAKPAQVKNVYGSGKKPQKLKINNLNTTQSKMYEIFLD